MARPRSVVSSLGKRRTSTSVKPLFTARLMIAAACASRSSSDTPDGFENFSTNAFFSASAAECSRMAAEAFSASFSAICSIASLAVGKVASGSVGFCACDSAIGRSFLRTHQNEHYRLTLLVLFGCVGVDDRGCMLKARRRLTHDHTFARPSFAGHHHHQINQEN